MTKRAVEACLADLNERIDDAEEAANEAAWQAFLDDKVTEGILHTAGSQGPSHLRSTGPTSTSTTRRTTST